jgi:nucleotide-binding universal stress UspA family protein
MHLRSILVGIRPGSPDGHPLPLAAQVAAKTGARLTALTVTDPALPGPSITPKPHHAVTMVAVAGVPPIEIARHAESSGANLIVLGRDIPTGRLTRDCGATVEGVVRRARVPCLLAPPGARGFGNLLVAVDGGPDSGDVIAGASLVGRVFGASVRVVRVEEPVAACVGAPTGRGDLPPSSPHDTIVYHGDPVAEILRAVREGEVDLLAIGHHRGGPVSPHATSGVASRLLQRATCAVLTVPI